MGSIINIPQEILHEIISCLEHDYADLTSCSLTCRTLWNVASAALYRDVNLSFVEDHGSEKSATERRQFILLETLAYNPVLAAHVRSFQNDNDRSRKDVVSREDTDVPLIIAAAKNMTQLTKGLFVPNLLAVKVITNIQSYPLQDLTIHVLDPRSYIWRRVPTTLRSLSWKFEVDHGIDPWSVAQFLINVVEATCPKLESLTINTTTTWQQYYSYKLPEPVSTILDQYKHIPISCEVSLSHLRHFSYHDDYNIIPDAKTNMRNGFLEFVTKHRHQLSSITIPLNSTSEYIIQVCNLLPNLKNLEVATLEGSRGLNLSSSQSMSTLSANPIIRNLERLSIADTQLHFSAKLGNLFSTFPNLKFLHIGDTDNKNGPFGDDRRLQCEDYAPHVLDFIKALPHSIEEIYLEINGEGLGCDDDDDFDPLSNLGPKIFKALPRLHTCDIHAWISGLDGGLGSVPEKAVFYRRLPHGLGGNGDVKKVWTSRIDHFYKSENINVTADGEEVEAPKEGFWQGKDAEEVWCGGFEFADRREWESPSGEESDKVHWPFVDVVRTYPMFKRNGVAIN